VDFDYVVLPAIILLTGILIVWFCVRRIVALSNKIYHSLRRVAERAILFPVAMIVAGVAGTSAYNAIALFCFRAANPPPGDYYTVNGHRMHINCTGSGLPTIILDAGLGNDALIWGGVQPVLSKTTRVCSYDRAGFGWSEAQPAPRDADHIAAELHELLLQAKVNGPIVLMGHSIAGLYIRDYATRYPAEVAGIVFIDSSTPLQDENPAFKAIDGRGAPQWVEVLLMKAAIIAGLPRLGGLCTKPIKGFEPHAGMLLAEDLCHPQISAMVAEKNSFNQSGQETVHTGPYGALPILIISHDPAKGLSKLNPPRQMVDMENTWSQMQENLKKLSTRSRRIIAMNSTHLVQVDRADLIEKEIPLFIDQIRGTAPPPTNYGSTITE